MIDLAIEESDEETINEVTRSIADVQDRSRALSLKLMLDGEDDERNAIVSINAGAGGTEAQDWAEMLFRMYVRWVERKGYKLDIIDYQPGDEAGIKGATFTATGDYAFGYMRSESGVHRLVRISPFNASGKRHTSFASVFIYPELDSSISIDIEDKDLRVDVYRASGAGGQHVNKTSEMSTPSWTGISTPLSRKCCYRVKLNNNSISYKSISPITKKEARCTANLASFFCNLFYVQALLYLQLLSKERSGYPWSRGTHSEPIH